MCFKCFFYRNEVLAVKTKRTCTLYMYIETFSLFLYFILYIVHVYSLVSCGKKYDSLETVPTAGDEKGNPFFHSPTKQVSTEYGKWNFCAECALFIKPHVRHSVTDKEAEKEASHRLNSNGISIATKWWWLYSSTVWDMQIEFLREGATSNAERYVQTTCTRNLKRRHPQ